MRLCQNQDLSMRDLSAQIQADPVLAGRIIKIANSVRQNRMRAIASVSTDVLLLVGVGAVRQLALGISLVSAYQNGACTRFDYLRFWSRSVAMACAAQALAACVRVAPAAEMFTCGLLADIGRLALASARPQAYACLLEEYENAPADALTHAETRLFGFSHLSLAAAMIGDWDIPRRFGDAVLFHESPQGSGFAEDTRQQRLVRVLQIAARLADICVADAAEREVLIAPLFELCAAAGIGPQQVAAVAGQTSVDWAEWGAVLQVQTRPLRPLQGEPGQAP